MAAFELIIPKGKYENSKAVENVINLDYSRHSRESV